MKIHDSRSFEKNFNEIKISMSEILNKSNIANDLKSSLWVTKSIEIYKKSIPNIEKIKISSFEISLNVIKDPENPTKKLCNYFDCSFDYFN
ncbi:MAG: hypothetical protein LBC39_08035 [Methanobrevibacter sp.]|jgi:hypothetical protein|nr:hypothetical protein [Candidatus Methanovirga aequatorialis]